VKKLLQLQLPHIPHDDEFPEAPARREARHEQVERQWRLLIRLLNYRRGCTLQSLCEAAVELGAPPVTDRTIRRDIDALIGAGFHIEARRDEGGSYWRLVDAAAVERLARHHSTAA
jgi:predicted DNA-binding transcriptional regulator YafY